MSGVWPLCAMCAGETNHFIGADPGTPRPNMPPAETIPSVLPPVPWYYNPIFFMGLSAFAALVILREYSGENITVMASKKY
jgi:hypothetical protein